MGSCSMKQVFVFGKMSRFGNKTLLKVYLPKMFKYYDSHEAQTGSNTTSAC